ncbi:uncharacterized protein LOC116771284 [Danaus plexippus]|uniref:uncharacterized protein LOC116771284 n=1 Tax=Danaus plexippus TaxID=13037 RepID=UPI002AB233FF|nr:uncharacterized protein LOC116771284 [Danaus plexippus]
MAICKYFQQGYCRFGQNCRNEHVFSSKYSYKAPQAQNSTNRVDNYNTNINTFDNSNASAFFRNAVQKTSSFQTPSPSMFAPSPTARPSVFDRLGQQPSFAQQNQAKSIFANANQSTFNQVPMNGLASQNQAAAKSLFAEASKNIFGQTQTNFNPTPVAANIFDRGVNQNISQAPSHQQSQPFGSSSVFHISQRPPSNPFGVTFDQTNHEDSSVYSELELLSEADVNAYESAEFKLGFIPELPPPRTFCA